MNERKEHLWQAYVDGELSAGEAAEFEASLTEDDRERLAEDMRFERALAERLSEGAECPDDVWERTRAMVQEQAPPIAALPSRAKRWRLGAATLAAAASVAFFISQYTSFLTGPDFGPAILAASTLEELAEKSEIEPGVDAAVEFFEESGIDLALVVDQPTEGQHRRVEVVGARHDSLGGEDVTELLMGCCGFPLKLLVAKRDSAAAHEISVATTGDSDIQSTRIVGDYLAAVVGHHPAHALLDVLGH